jgi:hypothetical protein
MGFYFDQKTAKKQISNAKKVIPSIRAPATTMAGNICFPASGCRATDSTALLPILLMPKTALAIIKLQLITAPQIVKMLLFEIAASVVPVKLSIGYNLQKISVPVLSKNL